MSGSLFSFNPITHMLTTTFCIRTSSKYCMMIVNIPKSLAEIYMLPKEWWVIQQHMTLGRERERKGKEGSFHIFQINNKGGMIVSPTRCMFRLTSLWAYWRQHHWRLYKINTCQGCTRITACTHQTNHKRPLMHVMPASPWSFRLLSWPWKPF